MACYHPISAFRPRGGGPILFVERGDCDPLQIACGQCVGCRLERSKQWACRCMHESQMHECNCFVTLTYADRFLPDRYFYGFDDKGCEVFSGNLRYRDFQLFMKRLRKVFGKKGQIRYYVAGEYGEKYRRPHFHALLFGIDFVDKRYWRMSPAGFKLYRSAALEQIWTAGNCEIGSVSFESAAYCARYVMKKVNGDLRDDHYRVVDAVSGEIIELVPEFNRMSLKPGIGARWLDKFRSDVYPAGKVVVNGAKSNAPRYYDKKYFEGDEERLAEIALRRYLEGRQYASDNSDVRLAAKEKVARARATMLKRTID